MSRTNGSRPRLTLLTILALAALLIAGRPTIAAAADDSPAKPNIVFILMDDFSLELLATMPEAQRMKAEGAYYDHSYVVDSLCCPPAPPR